ncbi:hypothetical protein LOZ53_006127 [Ophidiomyces ophidiicola]|nr:hypothetical protein LOZ55_001132 [Ophidiomyces ophidiicola]KAI1982860.1 hypothetical protein LOZ53_006127 [Ophidiomyces ophidiicola]KAI1988780.1 hypothetical protein LOZ54_003104 [Ophidiomyces ophidiicola]KAI1995518.1 hypothetical protein LOZ51_003344 [Ophidiomyces ophidiicola]
MVSRKRTRQETENRSASVADSSVQEEHGGLLHRLRNSWEFANLVQYIYMFGKAMKINDDFDIEDLETECLKPESSETLLEIGLCLLKIISSHRGLNRDNFEEYTRRQYSAKAPSRNPFGDGEDPVKFHEFDLFEKLRVLQQLAAWTLWNPEKFRERMPEQKETDQTQWRVEELGYDRDERLYYLLDDNRLYRRTDPPIPPPVPSKPKATSKKGRAAARAAKRRKLAEAETKDEDREQANGGANDPPIAHKWECIAITLVEYRSFVESLRKSKDPDEQILRDRLVDQVIPTIEKAEEAQQKKIQRKEKELVNLQKLATAKRSSRIASRQEKERQETFAAEEAKKREAERISTKKQQQLQEKIEKDRLYRLMTREQRLKDREEKRRQHEQHLADMEEQAKKLETGEARISERQLKAMMEKGKQDLEALQAEEPWVFDCSVCGVHGENLDDGSHSVACEKCNVWQHSQCLKIPKEEAERDDFHFICADCKQRIEDAKRPKIPPLKFRIPTSLSPHSAGASHVNGEKAKQQGSEIPPAPVNIPPPFPAASIPPMQVSESQPKPGSGVSPTMRDAPGSYHQYRPTAHPVANGFQPARPLSQNGTFYPTRQPQQLTPMAIQQPSSTIFPQRPAGGHPETQLKFIQHLPPTTGPLSNNSSFNSHRQSPSYSAQTYPSPIQNRPSMSPTQGNRDVGPLAGFPPQPTPSNNAIPSTPFNYNRPHTGTSPYLNQTPSASFSATPHASFSHTPPPNYAQPVATSGLSPRKHSPPRAPPSFSPNIGSTSVLPPVQKLHPSPKLMGRRSPDAPVPGPVKSMTPDQEDRRRREREFSMQNTQ